MVRSQSVRLGAVFGAVAFVALVSQLAGSAPVVGTGTFSLPGPGQPKDVWLGPNTSRVGARVTVTSGTAKVQQVVGGTPVTPALGQVTTGNSILWEGEYEKLQVVAMLPNTVGSYENRAPIGGSDPDRLVGEGSVTLQGGVMTPYMSQNPVNRMIIVTAGASPVIVKMSPTGGELLTIDAGDSAFVSHQGVSTYCVAGLGTVGYRVYDVAPSCGPYGGTCTGKNGDLDMMSADGTKNMSVTVTNTGPGTLTLVSQVVGSEASIVSLPPEGNKEVSGMLIRLDWTILDADPNRTTSVTYSVMGR